MGNAPLASLTLAGLYHRCQKETERFFGRQPYDDRFCFELFKRAIADGEQPAWQLLYQIYWPLVSRWVTGHEAFERAGEERDYFVNRAFERLWQALTPAKFATFASLAAVMKYLRLCAFSAVQEHVERRLSPADYDSHPLDDVAFRVPDGAAPVDSATDATWLWQRVLQLAKSDAERRIAEDMFLYGLKPQEIYEQRPDLFADVQQVYRIKENLVNRLRRDEVLRRAAGEIG